MCGMKIFCHFGEMPIAVLATNGIDFDDLFNVWGPGTFLRIQTRGDR